jgi:hypothetical protein
MGMGWSERNHRAGLSSPLREGGFRIVRTKPSIGTIAFVRVPNSFVTYGPAGFERDTTDALSVVELQHALQLGINLR